MIKNRCKVVVKGLNQERIITSLSKEIVVYNLKRRSQDVSCFEVDYKKQKRLKKLLKKYKLEILEISGRGIKHQFKKMLKSYGIVLGIVASLSFFAFQSVFVLRVRVFGTKTALQAQIVSYAEESLASKVRWKIDTNKLEQQIRNKFEDISFVSVAIVGQTLVINVNNAQKPEEMGEEFLPLVSDWDGRVEEINLIQGTAAVKKGQIVKKGDVLVLPYMIDSQGERREVCPKAEIKACVWLRGSENHHQHRVEKKRSGRAVVYNNIYLNDLLIFSGESRLLFDNFETETVKSQLTQGLLLPLYKETNIVYEVVEEEIIEKFEDKKEQIIENARQKALIFFKENDIIKEEYYTIEEGNGWHGVTYVLAVERNIGG